MKSKYFILALLLFGTVTNQAQNQSHIDSLIQLAQKETIVITKVKLLNQIAKMYRYSNPQKAIEYNQKAIYLIPKDSCDKLGNLYSTMGTIYGHIGELSQTLFYLDSAATLFTRAKSFDKLASIYSNMSTTHFFMSAFQKSAEYLYKSIRINEQFGDTAGLAYNFAALAAMKYELKEFEASIQMGRKVLEQYPLRNEFLFMGNTSLNIGLAYSSINKVDTALFYLDQGLDYFEKENYLGGKAKIYSEKSSLYLKHQQIDSAKQYIHKALILKEYITDQNQKLDIQMSLANIYFYENNHSKSIQLYDTVRKVAHKIPYRAIEKAALEGLIDNYQALKQYAKVAEYLRAYIVLKDTILNAEKQQQIKEMEIKYETNKKEQEIALLAKDRDIHALNALRNQQWAYSAFIILILVLLISFLLLRQNKLRAQQKTAQLKHQLLRNQMNPHFIFNALTAIQSYVYENNPKAAGVYLSSFAKLVRAILENSRKEYITLDKEIQWLENYLKLQLLRFDHQFEYQINLDPQLDSYELLIPPMLTQPFIENALEHGLKNIDYKGKITIQFTIEATQLLKISVEDNGIGYSPPSSHATSTHNSLATKITQERLLFLNKNQANDIHFSIKPAQPSGTIVSFIIPLKSI